MEWGSVVRWLAVAVLVLMAGVSRRADGAAATGNVTYDGRSLIINGQRKILFSGSIHYPRSTPNMWPSLIAKAKLGGVDVIQTYVFWNLHEPKPRKYVFSGRANIVRFIKEVQAQGLYVCLRIGPYIQGEWNYGGLPFWLHDIPGIVYRSDNEAFEREMQNFTMKIVNLMKENKLFASQGGPIILSQIENEYKTVEKAFHEKGPAYVRWAARMAVGLQTGVPWVMCKQDDAPDPVINACNGRRCGETFAGPNSPNKPAIWTENWTSFLQRYGTEPILRSAEDIAYQVALFIAKNGSYVNYYMYHGGTNFGRKASAFMITAYYDQAPLDEYGLIRQPKWSHLKELHAAVKLISRPLLYGKPSAFPLGTNQQAFVFSGPSQQCAAFLINNSTGEDVKVNFQNISYELPPKSISILQDCRTEVFNTAKVSMKDNTRTYATSIKFDSNLGWQQFQEPIVNFDATKLRADTLLEQMNTTKDKSDYLWLQQDSPTAESNLDVYTRGHLLHAFVNGKYDSGAYLERRFVGLRRVRIQGWAITNHTWGYQVGLLGERLKIYTTNGSREVQWRSYGTSSPQQLTWYKTTFDAPAGNDPLAINMISMGKGQIWVNGQSIGRYWLSFHTEKGNPSQTWYHLPRSFLKPTGNLLVILEEQIGYPLDITLDIVTADEQP
ncbi:hypothetical protein CDL15_Pgr027898 [Punica granatum]|uniref:Beta-galactosidase n=1 Tax=Punica granatum TaxID=22663 RepID=A0A218XKV8_PUNGR|nr:hypothetical protein CDL15_Pgr027898 [Punica granatum]